MGVISEDAVRDAVTHGVPISIDGLLRKPRRASAEVVEVSEVPGGAQAKVRATMNVEGSEKPVVVADFVARFLR